MFDQIKFLSNFLTKNNFTFLISIISLILSLYNWWYNFHHNKAKINLTLKDCKLLKIEGNPLSFSIIIENLSHLDVSISRMFLKVDANVFEFDYLPYHIMKFNAPEETRLEYSSKLPISIPALGAYGGFFCVRTDNYKNFDFSKLLSHKVSIMVVTNRKLKKKFRIKLTNKNAII